MTRIRWFALLASLVAFAGSPAMAQDATPSVTCSSIATPAANHDEHSTSEHDGHAEEATFDQLYIDMMVPHHDAVIALAEAALPTLSDPTLIEMAENVIGAQSSENEQLLEWRAAWFGSDEPAMDDVTMEQMLVAMPVGTMDDMMLQMDPAAQVAAFCAAENPDLAFAEQTLAHHQMAVDASVIALESAEHPELVAFATQVIADQEAEILLLNEFLAGLEATPAS